MVTLQNATVVVGLIIGISAVLGLLVNVYKIARQVDKFHDVCITFEKLNIEERLESLEHLMDVRKEGNAVMLSSILAILDGLLQMKCNGQVTVAHKELRQYLTQRGE